MQLYAFLYISVSPIASSSQEASILNICLDYYNITILVASFVAWYPAFTFSFPHFPF